MREPNSFEMGDEYDGDDRSSEDCSDEFEQGLPDRDQPLMDIAQARMMAWALERVFQ